LQQAVPEEVVKDYVHTKFNSDMSTKVPMRPVADVNVSPTVSHNLVRFQRSGLNTA